VVTAEDRERTEMYRRRLAGMVPSDVAGADLTTFLRQLEMQLEIHDRSKGDRTRAVQLINKTNQFNLNGRRIADEEVERILASGGRLFSASLRDRHGEHGEILSYLVTGDGVVESFVMSCRVFQRRVEHAFLCWLIEAGLAPSALRFAETARNEPIQQFLKADGFTFTHAEYVAVDSAQFHGTQGQSLELFEISASVTTDDRVTGVR
jgi:FkbH-like protein